MYMVLQLWWQEVSLLVGVARAQYRGEALGALRHKQQVARITEPCELRLQKDLEAQLWMIVLLGENPSVEYLRVLRLLGLGWGSIMLEGAVLRQGAQGGGAGCR